MNYQRMSTVCGGYWHIFGKGESKTGDRKKGYFVGLINSQLAEGS